MFGKVANLFSLISQFTVRVAECHECVKPPACDSGALSSVVLPGGNVATFSEIRRFVMEVMRQVGTPESNAEVFVEALIDADYRGYNSHGLNRLSLYVNDIRKKSMDPAATPEILKESVSTAAVDGHNGIGSVVAHWCMNLAIQKAEKTGIGIVAVKGSNHFGIGQTYVSQAIKKGMIGIAFTNTSPVMVPTRAKKAALGTNPLTVGAPARTGDGFMVDIATTVVSIGKIDSYRRKGEPLPEGWALNDSGHSETNPDLAMKYKLLYPLGGLEMNSGYKGFALGLMVEVFSGILGGANYGPNIRIWNDDTPPGTVANLGHCFIAINPKFFAEGFEARLQDLITYIRQLDPADPQKPVLIPGDFERSYMKAIESKGGISYDETQVAKLNKLAEELKVSPLKIR